MTKPLAAATVAITLAFGAAAGAATAAPTYGISVDGGSVNPFADKGGR